ncbi:uncharacterized protein G2W53_027258 [Senna tora]|uniref:Uncharacterized protein n=1 Tax=Senna tora TaxID=362788 RepID=A0A834TGI9_9FABA|nr:uncharacterized protein G2W53_027258 [Senna tora]
MKGGGDGLEGRDSRFWGMVWWGFWVWIEREGNGFGKGENTEEGSEAHGYDFWGGRGRMGRKGNGSVWWCGGRWNGGGLGLGVGEGARGERRWNGLVLGKVGDGLGRGRKGSEGFESGVGREEQRRDGEREGSVGGGEGEWVKKERG